MPDRHLRSTESRAAWIAELDRLELDVLVLERRLASGAPPRSDPWTVPEMSTPMPPELLEQALAIQERQLAALATLRNALESLGRQRAVAARMTNAAPDGPVYLDTQA
jgi:hypothetical protein